MSKSRNHDAGVKALMALEAVKRERIASELAAEHRARLMKKFGVHNNRRTRVANRGSGLNRVADHLRDGMPRLIRRTVAE